MQPTTLIQLISEQTMPNLLPALRLRPARLVHLVTPRTAARSACIAEAARRSGQSPALETIQLSAMPGIAETYNVIKQTVAQAREQGQAALINFTGGTKLMSIGAFAAATEVRAPSLYVDTDDKVFVSGKTGDGLAEMLEQDFSFTPLRYSLTVDVVAVANGRERVTGGRPWKPYAELAQHLLMHSEEERATHEAIFGPSGWLPGGREPRKPQDWLPVLERGFILPPKTARLAADCCLVESDAAGLSHLSAATTQPMRDLTQGYVTEFNRAYFKALADIQRTTAFLTGAWLEVCVMQAAERSGLYRDLRWSVNVGERDGADLEEDIVGLDGVQVLYISCKRGGAKARLLPLLDEMNARARSIGGNFTRRVLAIALPPAGFTDRSLRQRARELGIRIITGDDLRAGTAFPAPIKV